MAARQARYREAFLAEQLIAYIPDRALRETTAGYFSADNFTVTTNPNDEYDVAITVDQNRREFFMDTGDYGITYPMPGHGFSAADVSHRARAFVLNPESYMDD